jgi:hypothetical protein
LRRVGKFVRIRLDGWKRREWIRSGLSVFVQCFVIWYCCDVSKEFPVSIFKITKFDLRSSHVILTLDFRLFKVTLQNTLW